MMSDVARRFDRDFCAQGFVRAAQYFASMLTTADVLAESCQVILSIFAPDLVRVYLRAPSGGDSALPPGEGRALRRAIDQVLDTGFMAMESNLTSSPPMVYVVFPISVRGCTEAALLAGYSGELPPPAHALEVLLGVAGLIGASLARQRVTQELESSLERTRLILEAVGEGVCGMDGSGTITFINCAALDIIGCREADMVGRSGELLLHGLGGAADPNSPLRRALDQPASVPPVKGETTLFRHDGTSFPAEITCVPLVADGGICGLVMTFADISERKQSEDNLRQSIDELARSNTELERFAYIASHDLKEPLRTVVSFSQMLDRRCQDSLSEEGRSYLGFIVGGVKRMSILVEDLLAYSQVGVAGQPFAPIDANAIMTEVMAILSQEISDTQASVIWTKLPIVMADRSQLLLVMVNLVANGLKFARRGIEPAVRISAAYYDGMWEFAVADNGIGIEEQYFEQIFVIFKRLHSNTEYPGSGIGLAICKRIVERHGGFMRVDSTVGQGTCFFFTMPGAIAVTDKGARSLVSPR